MGARHKRAPAPVAAWAPIATLNTTIPGYASPQALTPEVTVPPTWAGAPSALPVIASRPGWVEVRLVARTPAVQSVWIRTSGASLSRTPYHVVVDLQSAHVMLFRRGILRMCAPAAVGSAQHPTPAGHYFVVMLAQSPSPAFGPFVIVSSAFANTVTDWEQSGMPMITVEGPLGSGTTIRGSGARITTGSVRLSDRNLARLRPAPAGTPLDVVRVLRLAPTRHNLRTCGRVPRAPRDEDGRRSA